MNGESITVAAQPRDIRAPLDFPLSRDFAMISTRGREAVAVATQQLLALRDDKKRPLRPDQVQEAQERVEGVLAGSVYAAANGLGPARVSFRGKAGQTDAKALRKLHALGWVTLTEGSYEERRQPTVVSGVRLEALKLGAGDIIRIKQSGAALCVLKDWTDKGNRELPWPRTDEAKQIADGVEKVNLRMKDTEIIYSDTGEVETGRVWGYRSFVGSLKRGGRMYVGRYQSLPSERRAAILLNREKTVEPDFGQCIPRIVSSMIGEKPPAGDIYDIPGLTRDVAKLALITYFGRGRDTGRVPDSVRKAGWTGSQKELLRLIAAKHPYYVSEFNKGIGMRATRTESDIMASILRQVVSDGRVALPVHDSLIIPASQASYAAEVMREAFKAHTGAEPVVRVK